MPYLDDPRALAGDGARGAQPGVENPFAPAGERAPLAAGIPIAAKPAAEDSSLPIDPWRVRWAKPAAEDSSLPIDPWRVWWALRRGWRWIELGALGGLTLGLIVGLLRMHTRYAAEFQLIKRYTPPTIQVSANGEPYKPRQFANSTLASAAGSPNVLERVARKADPPVSPLALKNLIIVKEDKLTDFVTMTISGYTSPEATVALAKSWSEEIINFTREIQSQESRDVRKVIQSQLDSNQIDLQGIDAQMAKYAASGQLLGADAQADTFVHLQEEIDAHYDASRMELDGITSQLAGLRTELARHTPAAEELRQARLELSAFQAHYTDKNPLVIERMEKVSALEAELKKQQAGSATMDLSDLNNHSGTVIGDQLYMQMVETENRRGVAERRMQDLAKQHDLFAKSPEKVAQIMELLQRKQMLRTAQAMLLSRLQEVRIYEENAPAYYGVYAPADVEHVIVTSKLFKCSILAVGGVMAGTFGALGIVLLLAVADRKLRTSGEAAKAADTPLLAAFAGGRKRDAAADETTAANLWTRWLGVQGETRRLRTVWCPGGGEGEEGFWRVMLAQAHRLLPGLLVIDGGRLPSPALAGLPEGSLHEWKDGPAFSQVRCVVADGSLTQVRDLQYFIESRLTEGMEVWMRLDGPVQEPVIGLVRATGSAPLLLAALHDATTGAFLKEQAGLLRSVGIAASGVVALNDPPMPARP